MMRALRLILAASLFSCLSAVVIGDQIPWAPDLATAQREAAESNRLVLIHFWADNCPPCRSLEENVFTRESVGQMLGDFFVPVKVNAREQPALAMQYGVDRWPTDVIINPTGMVLKKLVSPQDPRQYVAQTSAVALRATGQSNKISQAGFLGDRRSFSSGQSFAEKTNQNYWDDQQKQNQQRYQPTANGSPSSTQAQSLGRNGQPVDPGLAEFRDALNSKLRQASPPQGHMESTTSNLEQSQNRTVSQLRTQQVVQGSPKEIINKFAQPRKTPAGTDGANSSATPHPQRPATDAARNTVQGRAHFQDNSYFQDETPAGDDYAPEGLTSGEVDGGIHSDQLDNANTAAEDTHSDGDYVPTGDYTPADDYLPADDFSSATDPGFEANAEPRQPAYVSNGTDGEAGRPRLPSANYDAPLDTLVNDRSLDRRVDLPRRNVSRANNQRGNQPTGNVTPSTGDVPKSLDGYCPVTLANQNTWQKGNPRWGAVHRGRVYLFVGPEQQQEFLSDPDRFSPVLSGIDAVHLTEQRQAIDGKRQHGVFYRNQIYLFSSEASLGRFWSNPERYAGPIRQAMQAGTVDRLIR